MLRPLLLVLACTGLAIQSQASTLTTRAVCDNAPGSCPSGYICAYDGSQCLLIGNTGDSCDQITQNCLSGLVCARNDTCQPFGLPGQLCGPIGECLADPGSCGSDGICGSGGAPCQSYGGYGCAPGLECLSGGVCEKFVPGEGTYCRDFDDWFCSAPRRCIRNTCTSRVPQLGDFCDSDWDCDGARCSGTCGGEGAFCREPDAACQPGLNCLGITCSPLSPSTLGGPCQSSLQCPDSVTCGSDGMCGSLGSFCFSPIETGGATDTGPTPLCVSGYCRANQCAPGPSPAPGPPGKRSTNMLANGNVNLYPCPGQQVACPLTGGSFECTDPFSNLESCGGCVGVGMKGVDCTQLPHVEAVDCMQGQCVVAACADGYSDVFRNHTCVLRDTLAPTATKT